MKAIFTIPRTIIIVLALMVTSSGTLQAQEEKESPISVGADFVSRYIWRGLDFGNGPAVQPTVEFSAGNFALGAWGSYTLNSSPYLEADLYASYSFDFGLSLVLTDYYFPAAEFGALTDDSYFDLDAHTFEIGLSQEFGSFYVSGYYFLNANDDLYFETGYSFEYFDLFVGAGNKSYTSDGDFMISNFGLSTSKEIKISESYSLPVNGAVIWNPDLQQFHIVFGFSL